MNYKFKPAFALTLFITSNITFAHEYEAYARSAAGTARAYAGEVTKTEDASSAFANPAAMSKLKDYSQWSGVLHLMNFSSNFTGDSATYQNGSDIEGGNGVDAGGFFFGPNVYWVSEKYGMHRFGVAINTPYAYMAQNMIVTGKAVTMALVQI